VFSLKRTESIDYFYSEEFSSLGVRAILSGRSDSYDFEDEFLRSLYEHFNIPADSIIQPRQIHSSTVFIIKNRKVYQSKYPIRADAVIASANGQIPQCLYADCVPVYFYHPGSGIRALAHSGWRGTSRGIAKNVLRSLKVHFSLKPGDIHVAIGPSISQRNYEVDREVYMAFWARQPELMEQHRQDIFLAHSHSSKYWLDLKRANYYLLISAGCNHEKVYISDICTYSHPGLYSYRREGEQAGRMAGLLISGNDEDSEI